MAKGNPKAETPKVEPPKAETPKVEPPKAETPKVEPPKAETPKVDANAKHKKAVVDTFFKANLKAASLVIVGEHLFLGTYYGAAKEFAVRQSLPFEEILNPNLATEPEVEPTEGEDAEN
jgi:hypothetical protein